MFCAETFFFLSEGAVFCKYSQENKMPSVHNAADEFPSDPQRDVIPVSIKALFVSQTSPSLWTGLFESKKNQMEQALLFWCLRLGTTA